MVQEKNEHELTEKIFVHVQYCSCFHVVPKKNACEWTEKMSVRVH